MYACVCVCHHFYSCSTVTIEVQIRALYPFTGQIVVNITTTKEHAIHLSILINVDIGLCGRL